MGTPGKKAVKTAVLCGAGAAVLLFPGSVALLAAGAALGCWGCMKLAGIDVGKGGRKG